MIFLAQLTARDISNDELATFYFTSGPGMYDNAGNFYEPRIEQPALMKRRFSDKGFAGAISETYGELTLINVDGALDVFFTRYMFAGQKMYLWAGNEGDDFGDFTKVLVVTLYHPSFERERISFRIRDYSSTFDRPFLTEVYAGTNIGPEGVEGDTSIKGQRKPVCLGRPFNITPILVNSSLLIYQVSANAVEDIARVRDKGVPLAREDDYPSLSDIFSEEPSPGCYRVCLATGMFRLGSQPFGTVTASVIQYKLPWLNSAANIIKYILNNVSLGTGIGYVKDDLVKLDEKIAANIGYYVTDETTIAQVLDDITISVGAWWGIDNLGNFRVGRFGDGDWVVSTGSSTDILRITDSQILDYSTELLTYDGKPCPLYKVVINHTKNWTVQSFDDLAGSVSYEQQNWTIAEFRQTSIEKQNFLTKYPLASEVVIDSYIISGGTEPEKYDYALAEADRILEIYKARGDSLVPDYSELTNQLLTIKVAIDSPLFYQIGLGSIIDVRLSRFLVNQAGDLWIVVGLEVDYQRDEISLTLFRQ